MNGNKRVSKTEGSNSSFKRFLAIFAIISVFVTYHTIDASYYQITWDSTFGPDDLDPPIALSMLASNLTGTRLLATTTTDRLYLNLTGGDNWNETQPVGDANANWSSVAISNNGEILFASVYGGRLYRSLDHGDNWAEVQPAGNTNQNWKSVVVSSNGETVFASVYGGRIYRSLNHGIAWAEVQPAGNVSKNWSTLALDYTNAVTVAAGVSSGRLYLSTNTGTTWSETQPAGDVDKDWSVLSMDASGGKTVAGVNGGRLYTLSYGSSTWNEIQPAGNVDKAWSAAAFDNDASTLIVGVNPGRLYYSTTNQQSWYETQPDGNTNKNWSAIVTNTNGDGIWAANRTENLFYGTTALVTPAAPSGVATVSNTATVNTFLNHPLFQTTEVQNSGTSIFSQAHGNVQIGDKFYMGTRTDPAKIVVFNDPDDLSDYDSVSIAGLVAIESMTYDSVHNRIYASADVSGSDNLTIYSINPDNIHDYTQVVNEVSLPDIGSPGIVTDGTYLYGGTYATPAKIFKYRISNWSLVTSITWTGAQAVHAATLHVYNDRTELYLSTSLGDAKIAKVNASDLSYVEYDAGTGLGLSDDISFKYLDETGGLLYLGAEFANISYVLDTRTMTITPFDAPQSYGSFMYNSDLYIMGNQGYIAKYIDSDLDSLRLYKFSGDVPNEFFYSSSGKKFFTNWSIPGYLKEYSETTTLSTSSTVTLSWTESTPDVNFALYTSTDGISYTSSGSSSDTTYTFTGLTSGTPYWFKIVAVNDSVSSTPTIYTTTTASFTAAILPTIPTLVSQSVTGTSISLNWSGNGVEYLVKQGSTSSGWIGTTSYTFTNLACGHEYTIKLKAKNSDGVQSDYRTIYISTENCPGGGGIISVPPQAVNNEDVDFVINNGEGITSNRELLISMNADPDIVKGFSISLDKDFTGSSLLPYISKTIFTLPDITNTYTVYVRYYSVTGTVSRVMSKQVRYNSSKKIIIPDVIEQSINSTPEKNTKQNFFKRNLMFSMRGTDVKVLQNFLNTNGFALAHSGVGSKNHETEFFGRLTRAAVATFQKAKQITPTLGNFGPITRAYINRLISQE